MHAASETREHPALTRLACRSLTAEEYSQALKDYALVVEYQQLSMYAPSGVYVMPAVEDLRTWHGVAFLRQALYRGGIFKFTVTFPPQCVAPPSAAWDRSLMPLC